MSPRYSTRSGRCRAMRRATLAARGPPAESPTAQMWAVLLATVAVRIAAGDWAAPSPQPATAIVTAMSGMDREANLPGPYPLGGYSSFPILKILVPQSGHVP